MCLLLSIPNQQYPLPSLPSLSPVVLQSWSTPLSAPTLFSMTVSPLVADWCGSSPLEAFFLIPVGGSNCLYPLMKPLATGHLWCGSIVYAAFFTLMSMMQFALGVTVLPLPVQPERSPPANSRFLERPPFDSCILLVCDDFSVLLKEKYGK